jgi:serine/threonine protein kinase
MIAFSCSHCGMKFRVRPEFAGRPARCPACQEPLVVPASSPADAPTNNIDGPSSSLAESGVQAGIRLHPPGDATRPEAPAADPTPSTSGGPRRRYEVEKEIARGGMGAVLRALDYDLRREVAIKVLLHHTDPGKQRRFVEEAQITGQLEHPNIVPVHELGIDGQHRPYFTMKMVHGRSLAQALDRLREDRKAAEKEYTLGRLLIAFVGVCNALAYAHARGVVHRDLKPSNIMLGDFGEVYVMDWGIAKVLGDDPAPAAEETALSASPAGGVPLARVLTAREPEADLTQEGAIIGTPVYMPPEQATGRVNEIDRRSDIYSLGAVLYEILTLRPPFDRGGDYLDLLIRVAQGDIPTPEKRAPQRARAGKIPRELAAVAMKALARKPADRYPSVEELRRDIERFQEGRAVSAKDDTRWEQVVKFAKRHPGLTAVSLAAAVLLAVVLGFSFHINIQARLDAERALAELRTEREALHNEQKLKHDREQEAVPAFIRAAWLAVNEQQFPDAQAKVQVALEYAPQNPEARLLKAQLKLVSLDFAGAAAELEKYPDGQKDTPTARKLADLCRRARPDDPGDLLAVASVLKELKSPVIAERVAVARTALLAERKEKLPLYQKRIEAAWPVPGALTLDPDGFFHLSLNLPPTNADLEPLRGLPLSTLALRSPQLRDLGPLQGMPLIHLDLNGCAGIVDLTPLHGLPLRRLDLTSCVGIQDFKQLRGLPLESLELGGCAFTDLRVLQGLPLTRLGLVKCKQVQDLSPLRALSLTSLNLTGCENVKDLTPLRGARLRSLALAGCVLVADLTPLRELPLQELDLAHCAGVENLRALRDMKLNTLSLVGLVHIRDLTPLRAKSLTSLNLEGCGEIRDLSPLRGQPLTSLNIAGTGVVDLTPLEEMKLQEFKFTPARITMRLDAIRKMPTLKTFVVGVTPVPAADFWKRYDAGEFAK